MTENHDGLETFDSLEEMFGELGVTVVDTNDVMGKFLKTIGDKGMFGYNWKYLLTHPWEIVEGVFQKIRFACQRVFRGWDDEAVWSIDQYLAELLPKLIIELKAKEKGIPTTMFEEGDWDDENYYYKPEAMERAIVKWEAILDEIAEGFNEYAENCHFEVLEGKKFNRAFDLFREHFGSLWW